MTEARMDDYASWIGRTAVDRGAHRIGRIEDIYADDDTGEPEWLAVHTGWFGTHVTFVPLRGSRVQGDDLMVAYDKDVVKDAPRTTPDGHLSVEEEGQLYQYYGMGAADWSTTRNDLRPSSTDQTPGQPYDTTTGMGGRSDLAGDAGRRTEQYDTGGDRTATAETAGLGGLSAEDVRAAPAETRSGGAHGEGRARLRRWGEPR